MRVVIGIKSRPYWTAERQAHRCAWVHTYDGAVRRRPSVCHGRDGFSTSGCQVLFRFLLEQAKEHVPTELAAEVAQQAAA